MCLPKIGAPQSECIIYSVIDFLDSIVPLYVHYTMGKRSKIMCDTLVCIISFLAYTLIIKYLRGRKETQAKKVPLRLELTITQLLKSPFSLKRHSEIFCSIGCIHLEGFPYGCPNHQGKSPDRHACKQEVFRLHKKN